MPLADYYDEADVLDTLSWVDMTIPARIAKLANLYVIREDDMRHNHNRYEGATLGTVRLFVRSVYMPPRGQGAITYEGVLAAIPAQRRTREERERKPKPFVWKQKKLSQRRDAVAAARMSVWVIPRWEKKKRKHRLRCVGIGSIAGCRLIVLKGDDSNPKVLPRVHIQNLATGEAMVVVVEGNPVTTFTNMLLRLSPKGVLRGMFSGRSITLDFGGGWQIDGEFVPWRNVRGIYPASLAHKMKGVPAKPGEDD